MFPQAAAQTTPKREYLAEPRRTWLSGWTIARATVLREHTACSGNRSLCEVTTTMAYRGTYAGQMAFMPIKRIGPDLRVLTTP